jgi:diadenosine tetraphosphate (Ap4A) HIT family hydrolase
MALRFGPFKVPPVNVFHWSRHTAAIVNLKPIVPGHVLLISR